MVYVGRKEHFGGIFFNISTHQYFSVDENTWSYFNDLYYDSGQLKVLFT